MAVRTLDIGERLDGAPDDLRGEPDREQAEEQAAARLLGELVQAADDAARLVRVEAARGVERDGGDEAVDGGARGVSDAADDPGKPT